MAEQDPKTAPSKLPPKQTAPQKPETRDPAKGVTPVGVVSPSPTLPAGETTTSTKLQSQKDSIVKSLPTSTTDSSLPAAPTEEEIDLTGFQTAGQNQTNKVYVYNDAEGREVRSESPPKGVKYSELEVADEEAKVKVVDDSSKFLYTEIPETSNNDDLDTLSKLRLKYRQKQDLADKFIVPWDSRLGKAYSNTQSVGNYMPYGPEWVGSPSLMNDLALIRFDHIAGSKHHHNLIDQRSLSAFRGRLVRPFAKIDSSIEGEFKPLQEGDKNSRIRVTNNEIIKKRYGVLDPSSSIYADEEGALYVEEDDLTQGCFSPQNSNVAYKKSKASLDSATNSLKIESVGDAKITDPEQICIDTPNRDAKNSLDKRSLKNSSLKNSPDYVDAVNKAKGENDLLSKYQGDGGGPNSVDYWLSGAGAAYYLEGTMQYVNTNVVDGNGTTVAVVKNIPKSRVQQDETGVYKISQDDLAKQERDPNIKTQNQAEEENFKNWANAQAKRNWVLQNNQKKKRYLQESNVIETEILEPTIYNLCENFKLTNQPQFPYKYTDFLYCKYNGNIPNNYLVTLRRFPAPVLDSGKIHNQDTEKKFMLPIAQAITWLGETTENKLGDLLGMTWNIRWRDLESAVNEITGNEQGAEDSPFPKMAEWLGMLSGSATYGSISGWDEQRAKFDPYKDGAYANRIYGPVNVITKTKARDRGLDMSQNFSLNFHYSLKSYGGVNPKAAMLDVMSNILALTYNNANFWGGANRYFPNKPAYPFPGGAKGMKAWYSGNPVGFLDGIADQLVQSVKNLGSMIMDLFTNPAEALKGLAGGGAKLWMAKKQAGKRPGILNFKALLTGDPVGEWHLVVGNPFNPIAMIGNLVCKECKVTFGEQLGVDDFPTEMTVTIQLEHGRPRDKGDIESMFNRGGGRLHYSYFGKNTEAWNTASSTRDSRIDTSWKKGNQTGKVDKNGGGEFEGYNTGTLDAGPASKHGRGTIFQGNPNDIDNALAVTRKTLDSVAKEAFKTAEKIGFKSGDK